MGQPTLHRLGYCWNFIHALPAPAPQQRSKCGGPQGSVEVVVKLVCLWVLQDRRSSSLSQYRTGFDLRKAAVIVSASHV